MSISVDAPPCNLCGSVRVEVSDSLRGDDIKRMWDAYEEGFSPEQLLPVTSRTEVNLFQCCNCGFRYFDPSLAGGAAFYEHLSRRPYYPAVKPEFTRAAQLAQQHSLNRVCDVGCGGGYFLDMARKNGHETFGLELNPRAAAMSRSKGHHIFADDLSAIAATRSGSFDLVTAFQVIEHVPNPVEFLELAARLVRPQGYVVVGVPNSQSIHSLAPLDPHEWPPHHLSRWRFDHLRLLGERVGLDVVEQNGEITSGSQLRDFMRLNNRMAKVLHRANQVRSPLLITIVGYMYTLLGMKHWTKPFGGGAYTAYRKPG
ncbi:MAG TPA: class I SAM-dependent methyltransferase [Candidatus Acidoferrum sp.]|nr:class I SAM-dependent methyltransferase [Candidatus Acidoferrum sp.]